MFTTSVVGSFSRPKFLIDAFDDFSKGKVTKEQLEELLQDATKLIVKEEELAGLDVITDGEQRRTSFVSFVGQKIAGFKPVHIKELRPDALEVLRREKVQLTYWRAVATEPLKDSVIALDELQYSKTITDRQIKITLPSPYLVMWETWHSERSRAVYPEPEDLAKDYAKILRREILRLKDAGVAFVQLDEPMLGDLVEASETEPDRYRRVIEQIHGQKYRGFREEARLARDLVNEAVQGVQGVRVGMHMDRWPNADSPNYGVGYEKLFPEVLDIKVKQFVLEYASPGSGDPVRFAEALDGQEMALGVVQVMDRRVEEPQEIVSRVEGLAKLLGPERVWLVPDCGFAPGMYRGFPKSVAFAKLKSMVAAAGILRKKFS
ncbi:MAG: cobalamin-independent methionine synthase II family protein [Nitrososphaerota archaeon]|nr:cobalamin-independent methionine synthase II family protein [Nitrososphaerota archaeon]